MIKLCAGAVAHLANLGSQALHGEICDAAARYGQCPALRLVEAEQQAEHGGLAAAAGAHQGAAGACRDAQREALQGIRVHNLGFRG